MSQFKTIRISLFFAFFISAFGSLQAQEQGRNDPPKDSSTRETKILNKANMKNSNNMKVNPDSEEALVCQLTGPEQASRKAALQKEVFSQVKKIEESRSGYIFYFPFDEDFLIQLTDFVITENSCCPFFTFDIRLQAKNDVRLCISGDSEKAKSMIKMALIKQD